MKKFLSLVLLCSISTMLFTGQSHSTPDKQTTAITVFKPASPDMRRLEISGEFSTEKEAHEHMQQLLATNNEWLKGNTWPCYKGPSIAVVQFINPSLTYKRDEHTGAITQEQFNAIYANLPAEIYTLFFARAKYGRKHGCIGSGGNKEEIAQMLCWFKMLPGKCKPYQHLSIDGVTFVYTPKFVDPFGNKELIEQIN